MMGCEKMKISSNSGLTFIETLITATIITFLVFSALNLLQRSYKSYLSSQLKAISVNLANDKIEFIKHYGFSSLKLTPDDCISDKYNPILSQFASCSNNPYPPEIVTSKGVPFTIYKIVMNAEEDSDGNLVPRYQSELEESNIKMIRVIVTYMDNQILKQTAQASYISDKSTLPLGVSSISGFVRFQSCRRTGRWVPIMRGVNAVVYIEGYPGLQGVVNPNRPRWWWWWWRNANGYYRINNVPCGKSYFLYIRGNGIGDTAYSDNPFDVDVMPQDYTNVNFDVTLRTVDVSGTIYVPNAQGTPVQLRGISITATDMNGNIIAEPVLSGILPTPTPSPSPGFYFLSDIIVNRTGSTIITITGISENYYRSITLVVTPCANYTGKNITVNIPLTNMSIVKGAIYDYRDREQLITDDAIVNIQGSGNPQPTPVTLTAGSGEYSVVSPPLPYGSYVFSASAPDYKLESEKTGIVNSPSYTAPDLFMIPLGKISGYVTDNTTGFPISGIPIRIIENNGAGSVVKTVTTDINGYYLAVSIPAATNYYKVVPYLAGTSYDGGIVYPSKKYYSGVSVQKGVITSDLNFKLEIKRMPIQGKVYFNNEPIYGGVLTVIPSGLTQTPDKFYSDNTDADFQTQNNVMRLKFPNYSTIIKSDGSYYIEVPASGTYDLYAYYSFVSDTVDTVSTTPTVFNFYQKIEGVSPGGTQDFMGSWTSY